MNVNTSEPRAKSRIAKPRLIIDEKPTVQLGRKARTKSAFSFSMPKIALPTFSADTSLISDRITVVPSLILSLVLYGILLYIFTSIPPQDVANWLLYQSYLPVVVIFFFATVFMARFIFLRKSVSWGIGLWLTLLLFLKLQQFTLTFPIILVPAVLLVGSPLIWQILFRK